MNLLLSGSPGVGKTTTCRMIMDQVERDVRGFVTEDIRHDGGRVGFMVEFDNGESRVLSHVDFDDPEAPTVGKYTVDLETMDRVVDTMTTWHGDESADLYIIDEIGKMELKHDEFGEQVEDLLESPVDLLATIPRSGPEFVDTIRERNDVEGIELTEENREDVLKTLVDRLNIRPVESDS